MLFVSYRSLMPLGFALSFVAMIATVGCRGKATPAPEEFTMDIHDPTIQHVLTLQNQRDTRGLYGYFKEKLAAYRYASAVALGSVQDSAAVDTLALLLRDAHPRVRAAAAYSLGQSGSPKAVLPILRMFARDSVRSVQLAMLEAVGRVGEEKHLRMLCAPTPQYPISDHELVEGQAWAIYRFALRKIIVPEGTNRIVDLLSNPECPARARFVAANYLFKASLTDLQRYESNLVAATLRESEPAIKMFLVIGLAKTQGSFAFKTLSDQYKNEKDDRIRINIVRGIGAHYPYDSTKIVMFDALRDMNPHVAQVAAQHFVDRGRSLDASLYFDLAIKQTNSTVAALLFQAALRYASDYQVKAYYSQEVIKRYQAATDPHQQASLLRVLGELPWNYRYIAEQVLTDSLNRPAVVRTAGMQALVDIFQQPGFSATFGVGAYATRVAFNDIFRQAIGKADVGLIAVVAPVLRDARYGFKTVYTDYSFLKATLSKLRLPADIEAYNELEQTVAYFDGRSPQPYRASNYASVNFQLLQGLKPEPKVQVTTSRGKLVFRLLPLEAPATVSYFIELVRSGYYNGKVFHRVVPNFVVQTGCVRGDGYSGTDRILRSEFSPLHYDSEGWVGMASAGKDTESAQFFITLAPAIHLDGRYTIFGRLTEGAEVLQTLQVGDKIEKVELL